MPLLDTIAILIVLAAAFGYLNHRFWKLPLTIGLLLAGLVSSMGVLMVDRIVPGWELGSSVRGFMEGLHFAELLLRGMLGFLLFAGSLHVDLSSLMDARRSVLTLATVGVLLSTALVGFASWAVLGALGIGIPLLWCLVFGAMISPTDPIAVLGIMKSAGAPDDLKIRVAGESLFNDGIGVIVFTVLLGIAAGGHHGETMSVMGVLEIFLKEVVGGLLLGFLLGYVAYQAMHDIEEANLEILISLALVFGILFFSHRLHTSAPLACVVSGLFIGNHGRSFALHEAAREALDLVWEFIDEALNAVLFLLIGFEVFLVALTSSALWAGVVLIPVVLVVRFVSVATPLQFVGRAQAQPAGTVRLLTWGGLKGGISVALALMLPAFEGRDTLLTVTYVIVVFSVVVQGLSVGRLLRKIQSEGAA